MRRTPLVRRTPLETRTGLKRGGRINPISARRRKRDAVYQAARDYVMDRSRGACEAPVHADGCSGRVEQVHHIAGRGGPDPHHVENLLGLSAACHARAHAEPLWARRWGLSRSRHTERGRR